MSVYTIYLKDGAKMMRPVLNREDYLALRNGGCQQSYLERIRKGEENLKFDLVQMNYSCLPNEDGSLKGSSKMSNSVGMDIDHIPAAEMENVKQRVLSMKEKLGLLMMEESARGEGYHLVFRRNPALTQVENLKWASGVLDVEYDNKAKDITRVFFTTTEAELVYLDDAVFDATPLQCYSSECEAPLSSRLSEAHGEILRDVSTTLDMTERGTLDMTERGTLDMTKGGTLDMTERETLDMTERGTLDMTKGGTLDMTERETLDMTEGRTLDMTKGGAYPTDYNGTPYTDIITKYWELFNDGKIPVEGDRNALTFELSVTIRSICGYSLERMMQIVPNYWAKKEDTPEERKAGEAEWRKTIENALKEPRKGMPYRLKQVLQALKSTAGVKACGGTLTTPPPMPKKLPPLIKLLTSNVPWFYKPAVANAVFPALGAHLHGVKFRYWDNVDHEATFMNVLVGRQSIGKGSIKKPIEYIMEDIRQRDQPNRQREADWKQKNPGNRQKKDPRPTDICIQMLIDNLTDAVFNQRIVDANNNGERFIYTSVDEIDALKKVTSKGSADEVGLLIRKAFDNSLAGQERVGADSVSGIAPLRWNFNASTTPPIARKFFYKMVNDGTVSRLDISTIIRAEDDEDADPILGIYDHRFAAELKPYIDRLEAASGLIECPQAKKLALEMKQENRDAAKLFESEAYRVFSYRANVIAWLKGMVLYVAHGYKWDKTIADFVRWTEQYNLWCKMLYFGQQLERELREELEIQRQSGPQNLLELLPDEFTKEQYYQMRKSQGRSGDGESTLRTWASRNYIAFDEVSGRYCKTEAYKQKYGGKI